LALLYLIAFYQRVAPAVITELDFGLCRLARQPVLLHCHVAAQIPTVARGSMGAAQFPSIGAALTAAARPLAIAPTVAWANAGRLAIGAPQRRLRLHAGLASH
jgi:hypothetical protein